MPSYIAHECRRNSGRVYRPCSRAGLCISSNTSKARGSGRQHIATGETALAVEPVERPVKKLQAVARRRQCISSHIYRESKSTVFFRSKAIARCRGLLNILHAFPRVLTPFRGCHPWLYAFTRYAGSGRWNISHSFVPFESDCNFQISISI